ncbi:hypothetical protein ACIQM4_26130 [Streptomyces sp. NPDC091272]|uniref:hypothetical protein n=1 Tax=Streptomyces sp. NPDC091272 TaxID=3365981 RepID=UPI0038297E0A
MFGIPEAAGGKVFLRGRSPIFWLLFITTLYLILTVPESFAEATQNLFSGLVDFLRATRRYFEQLSS